MGNCAPQIFIFDEPTTGLHFHDIHLLLKAFNDLIALGHTLVIVEHNLDVVKCADHVIDLGPEGGEAGGMIVATGTPEEVAANRPVSRAVTCNCIRIDQSLIIYHR